VNRKPFEKFNSLVELKVTLLIFFVEFSNRVEKAPKYELEKALTVLL